MFYIYQVYLHFKYQLKCNIQSILEYKLELYCFYKQKI